MHFQYLAILPITGLLGIGYLVLSNARGAQGTMGTFGKILAAWAFLVAAVLAACAIHMATSDDKMMMFHHRMHGPMGSPGYGAMPPPPASAPETPALAAPPQ